MKRPGHLLYPAALLSRPSITTLGSLRNNKPRRKRFIPEVVITNIPKKRAGSPQVQEVEDMRSVYNDGANGSPKGKKRQKKIVGEDYLDGPDGEAEADLENGSKGRARGRHRRG